MKEHIVILSDPVQIERKYKKLFVRFIDELSGEIIIVGFTGMNYYLEHKFRALYNVPICVDIYPNTRYTKLYKNKVYYNARPATEYQLRRVKKLNPELFI